MKSTIYVGNDLEQGSLYVLDSQHRWHLLRPCLTLRESPDCGDWSTFHIDRSTRDAVSLKSLEHGHQVLEGDLVALFRKTGVL